MPDLQRDDISYDAEDENEKNLWRLYAYKDPKKQAAYEEELLKDKDLEDVSSALLAEGSLALVRDLKPTYESDRFRLQFREAFLKANLGSGQSIYDFASLRKDDKLVKFLEAQKKSFEEQIRQEQLQIVRSSDKSPAKGGHKAAFSRPPSRLINVWAPPKQTESGASAAAESGNQVNTSSISSLVVTRDSRGFDC